MADNEEPSFENLLKQLEQRDEGPGEPGSASQVFAAPPRRAPEARPASTSDIADNASVPAPATEKPATKVSPGEFTQIFTKMPLSRAASEPSVTKNPPPPTETAPEKPAGEFTQFFRALDPQQEPARPVAPPANAFPSQATARPQAPTETGPGGFTGLFKAPGAAAPPLRESAPPQASPMREQPFRASSPTQISGTAFSAASGSKQAASPGITELMRALDTPSEAASGPTAVPSDSTPDLLRPEVKPGGPGEFTSMLKKLEEPSPEGLPSVPARQAQPTPPALPPPPVSAGPSDFTRVIQGPAAGLKPSAPVAFTPAKSSVAGGLSIERPGIVKPALPSATAPAPSGMAKWVPWLLIVNAGLLLLVLALLVFLLLRHH